MADEPELAVLRDRDAWTGGFYELAVQLGKPDDGRLEAAMGALARAAGAEGPWQVQWDPDLFAPASWTVADLDRCGHLRGLVMLPDGQRAICSVIRVREQDGDDWLDLCLPLEALGQLDARVGGYPFGPDGGPVSLAWRRPVDDWLTGIARQVARACPFRMAAIGFEVSGSIRAEDLADAVRGDRAYALLLADGTCLAATA